MSLRLVFVGESWQGSSARSLREALLRQPDVTIADVGQDTFLPPYRALPLRLANRLLRGLQVKELERAIRQATSSARPDAVVVYKGPTVGAHLVRELQQSGCPVINVYPDCSPHAFGPVLREALGCYDLVISTKPFHPRIWRSLYGYSNPCVCVPHGYDPEVHLWHEPPAESQFDVVLCGTWRPEYERLMRGVAAHLSAHDISVAVGGLGWERHFAGLPPTWQYVGAKLGRAYGDFIRSGKIAIAPVARDVVVDGKRQLGDEDTTRTYELAAAHCFFLHQRTDYVATIYDPVNEVPLWDGPDELAKLILHWLPDESGRRTMAAAAHARAVPEYSIPCRAAAVKSHISAAIAKSAQR